MPVLIFEGVQGVGKSAILEELERLELVQKLPFTRVQALNIEEYVKRNITHTQQDGQRIVEYADTQPNVTFVVDRFTASEYVFGQVCFRKQDYKWIETLEKEMAKHDILLVYIYGDYDFVCSNIWKRRAAYVADLVVQKLPEALALYSQYINVTPFQVLSFKNNHARTVAENASRLWSDIKEWRMKLLG